MIFATLMVFAGLLLVAEVYFDSPYHCFLERGRCDAGRGFTPMTLERFMGRGLPFVLVLIGAPLLFCSFWDGLGLLLVAGASWYFAPQVGRCVRR